jgi:hypothetical protein
LYYIQRDQQWLLAMKQLINIGVFLFRNWHWPDVLTWRDIKKKIRLCRVCLCYLQKWPVSFQKANLRQFPSGTDWRDRTWPFDGKRQIRLSTLSKLTTGNAFRVQWYENHSNFHCHQQIQSFFITLYYSNICSRWNEHQWCKWPDLLL